MAFSRTQRVIVGLGVAALGLLGPTIADACGSFFSRSQVSPEQRPSLSREKVLLIYDAAQQQQHFVREVAFRRAKEPFGFVVPTPTRPEVVAVETTPFTRLRELFSFTPRPRGAGGGTGRADGAAPRLEVLEQKQIGSFTAFVLAANDAAALQAWLAKHQLVSDEASDAWLEHYVDMNFYYVAMRYDPPSDDPLTPSDAIVAETIRISFSTPLPYYPYLEPSREVALDELEPRLLELWYVGAEPVVPVALRERDDQRAWVQPLQRGRVYQSAQVMLPHALEAELESLLPEGPLVVQTFQDQKRVREGFGDVLFVFERARELTPELAAELAPLLGILDPALIPEREPSP